ncbi:hypothetical protein DDI_3287 [Dickeya dianthicola RNS04.9]|nr:hypothetical protein DDI_3287 [Dickeya dianthicola RNS04.9]
MKVLRRTKKHRCRRSVNVARRQGKNLCAFATPSPLLASAGRTTRSASNFWPKCHFESVEPVVQNYSSG